MTKLTKFFILLAFTLCSAVGWAVEEIRFYEWDTQGRSSVNFVIPVRGSERPEEAALIYLDSLKKNPDMMELFEQRIPDLPINKIQPLNADREKRALLLANKPIDYTQSSDRVRNFAKYFAKRGQNTYLLPIASNLNYTPAQNEIFFEKISAEFPFMVAMGGADVDPSFYGEASTYSVNTNKTRDRLEIGIVKSYIEKAKGFLLGVCRGSQLAAVALGYKLIQDLSHQVHSSLSEHKDGWHSIRVNKNIGSVLGALSDSSGLLEVNSLHHQAVEMRPDGPLEVVALDAHGVVEATQLKNGRGVFFQFHPELMENPVGEKILSRVVKKKNTIVQRSCSGSFIRVAN